ncbi:hypothetical protein ACRS9C_11435 [Serratia marcescens]|uniref:hypothetical protein n=1 Tax=Serratia marcescens TaxID=615 RepID=UPI003EE315E1
MTKNSHQFENEKIILNKNFFYLKSEDKKISLSSQQSEFMWCLVRNVVDKKEVINEIWPNADWKEKRNNYNQILFQIRKLLLREEFPGDTIIPMTGGSVCLNANLIKPIINQSDINWEIFNDKGLF